MLVADDRAHDAVETPDEVLRMRAYKIKKYLAGWKPEKRPMRWRTKKPFKEKKAKCEHNSISIEAAINSFKASDSLLMSARDKDFTEGV